MTKRLLAVIIAVAALLPATAAARYVGGDISLLPEYENAGAVYLDHDGNTIADVLPWFGSQGMNAMRVRLFVNPGQYTGSDKDANACQDMEYILPLCRRIKDAGYALMLDFHYSDTWADPTKQWTPAQWAGLADSQLCERIYSYTRETLQTLADAGATPDFIQTGNEISYGMLWGPVGTPEAQQKRTYMGSDANWQRLGQLLSNAIRACREVCPSARVILHTERVADTAVMNNFYSQMRDMSVDYDIIGLSYYPYWHGGLSVLRNALDQLTRNFPGREIMIVETGYSYKWAVPGTTFDLTGTYPYSDAGQAKFADDLVALLAGYEHVTGLFWWWPEYNAYGTSLSGWYNAPLFDSTTGCATSALSRLCRFADDGGGVSDVYGDTGDAAWYDLAGVKVSDGDRPTRPGVYIHRSRPVLLK